MAWQTLLFVEHGKYRSLRHGKNLLFMDHGNLSSWITAFFFPFATMAKKYLFMGPRQFKFMDHGKYSLWAMAVSLHKWGEQNYFTCIVIFLCKSMAIIIQIPCQVLICNCHGNFGHNLFFYIHGNFLIPNMAILIKIAWKNLIGICHGYFCSYFVFVLFILFFFMAIFAMAISETKFFFYGNSGKLLWTL